MTNKNQSTKNLLIVGGGIAGMSLAIRMRALGWAVDIVELDPNWRVYGAGISVTAPTYRAFKRLGVLDDVVARGYASFESLRMCDAGGRVLASPPMPELEPGLPTHGGIMRPVLHTILSDRTRASGAQVRLGVTIESFTDTGSSVRVLTTDGATRDYDLMVGADGVFSKTRGQIFPEAPKPRYTGQYCWRMVAERPPEHTVCHMYSTGNLMAGAMPTSPTQMYMFLLSTESPALRLDPVTQWQQLKQLMAPFGGLPGKLRDGIDAQSAIIARPLESILLPLPWHRGRVALIGDAAHATTPHLASGAGISVEDALVLSELLGTSTSIETALQSFEARRWERCRMVVENSVRVGELEQSHADHAQMGAIMVQSLLALRVDI
jgi:2-polyprenyl-6-methoxyphenol hydroxylase-like FAD-dependent oxidoreductase